MSLEANDEIVELSVSSPSQNQTDDYKEKPKTSSSNVYTPLLSGARLLSSTDFPKSKLDSSVPTKINKSNLAVLQVRGQRSSVKPFFCCGSELSLVSLVDGLDMKDEHAQNVPKLKSIEYTRSSSEEDEPSLNSSQSVKSSNLSSNRSFVRRKKKDKHSAKKKFWSLRLRGRWNTRWRVSQPQRSGNHRTDKLSHQNSKAMSQGTYQSANSPGLGGRTSRARAASNSSQLIDMSQMYDIDEVYPTDDDTVRMRRGSEVMGPGAEVHHSIFDHALRSNLGISNSMLDILRQRTHLESLNSESTRSSPVLPLQEDYSALMNNFMLQLQSSRNVAAEGGKSGSMRVYTQVDFIHCLVPELNKIMSCPFYWGIMDRYEAERLLDNKPEGTFLLRDSAQEDFLFSVSFRRYNRSLHARVEQLNHRFSFDAHDPCVFSASSVCELMEHYKDPSSCMFFEPKLTRPLPRNFTFSLQQLCRAVICDTLVYDQIHDLPIPNSLKQFLQAYHYKQKVRVRHFDGSGVVYADNQVMLD